MELEEGTRVTFDEMCAIAAAHQNSIPSKNISDFWIYAENQRFENNETPGDNSGKWMIFETQDKIDETWEKIKVAVEDGLLGHSAKVATKKCAESHGGSSDDSWRQPTHVICVYTFDWTNEKDVMRVREKLREMGFTSPLSYKSDEDTLAGKYRATGHKKISKYRC